MLKFQLVRGRTSAQGTSWPVLAMALLSMLSSSASVRAADAASSVLKRFPDASADAIVFVARGDLWQVARAGGVASPLTTGQLRPVMPRFSPDGRWIAFSASAAGHQDVYVMPAAGGAPRRLTFNPNNGRQLDDMVVTWTPDSQHIVFGSQMAATSSKGYRLFMVAAAGGLPQPLPMEHAGLLSYAADAHRVAYASSLNDFDSRKRYDGGMAQDIYTYDLQTHASARITDWKGNDGAPMWYGATIYFLSDRDGRRRVNLWAYDEKTKKSRQLTFFTRYDIDFPSLGGGQITFQQGGKLYALELPSERLHEIAVAMPPDAGAGMRQADAGRYVRNHDATGNAVYALAPDGSAAAFSARGDLFSVAMAGTERVNLTATSGADEEHPAYSPDGTMLAYVTDAGGEQQVALRPAHGGAERIVTRYAQGYLYTPLWSPDGKALAVADGGKRLWHIDLASGATREVAHDLHRLIDDAAFSPDGRWLAYSLQGENQQRGIHLYDLGARQDHLVSSPMDSDHHPVFSADGRYLYFISARTALPVASSSEEAFATVNADGIYVTTLRRQERSAVAALAGAATSASAAAAGVGADGRMAIEFDGLMRRTVPLPVASANIAALAVRGAQVFYLSHPIPLVGGELPGQGNALHVYDMRAAADRVVLTALDNFVLSGDGGWLLYKQGTGWSIAPSAAPAEARKVALTGMMVNVDLRQEWAQMYNRVWRLDRDFYLSPTMNGIDWPAVRTAYAQLLPLLGSRDDLNYLIGQVQGELATSHMVYWGGDFGPRAPSAATPRLGADYRLDAASGTYQFARIYPGDNSRPALRSPLSQPGAEVHEGEYLLAVNGKPLAPPQTPDSLLEGMDGPLDLLVAADATATPRHVAVTPVQDEFELREEFMIEQNRRKVARLSGGRVAYLYLADFEERGAEQFVRQFYPQMGKQALIIDVRDNAGGYTSQQILERLRRTAVGMYANRNGGRDTLPAQLMAGPKVTLINEFSGSDGDQFAYYFRQYGLGKVIGRRSWGGVRGVTSPLELADGGRLFIPKDALYSPDGHWIIENHGTDPDLVVADVPGESLAGRDAQLEAAITLLNAALDRHPTLLPAAPPALPSYPAAGQVPGPSF